MGCGKWNVFFSNSVEQIERVDEEEIENLIAGLYNELELLNLI